MTPFAVVRNVFFVMLSGLVLCDYFIEVHWIWYVLFVGLFLIYVGVGSASMKYNIFVPAYTSLMLPENKIAITFDDGPVSSTENVLEVLNKYKAKASFFCIGKRIEQNPDLVQRAHIEGHLVGNHSYSHHNFFSFFGHRRIADEIGRTNTLIENITGKANDYFRPPYGVTNPAIAKAVKIKQMKVIGWNLRSFDTTTTHTEKVINRILTRLQPGSVVLLHDNREETAHILEAILLYARKKDYKCVTVDEMFKPCIHDV